MADGGWRMADGGWRMADGGWRMADGGWRMADGGWRMADGGWRMADGGRDNGKKIIKLINVTFREIILNVKCCNVSLKVFTR